MQSINWAPEHSAALREYLAKDMSYSEIANAINAKFKTAYSRNAAIGRAKRMGLAGPDQRKDLPKHRRPTPPPKVQQPRLRKPRKGYAPEFMRPTPIFERTDTDKLRCVEIDPRHLSLTDLERGDCRYPYGGDEEGEAITFCGHRRRQGSSYCAPHFHLTRGRGTASERAAGTALLRLVEAALNAQAKLTPAIMTVRMKRLPHRYRIAPLRNEIQLPPLNGVIQRGTGKA